MKMHPRSHRYPEPVPCPSWVSSVQGREVTTLGGSAYLIETTGRWSGEQTYVVSTQFVDLETAR
jgi:hypothetical protein